MKKLWDINVPSVFPVTKHIDERGVVSHFRDLEVTGATRIYFISNSTELPFRGWHAHRHEAKLFACLSGEAVIRCVKLPKSGYPDKESDVEEWHVSGNQLSLLVVPAGYANSIETSTPSTEIMVISNRTLGESILDDFRLPEDYFTTRDGSI